LATPKVAACRILTFLVSLPLEAILATLHTKVLKMT
jgi:hypothetical protein